MREPGDLIPWVPAFAGTNGESVAGTSYIYFSHRGHVIAVAISQKLRPDAVAVIEALAGRGLDLRILSGDRDDAVGPVARALGIEYWQGGLKPADKIALIEALKTSGRRVLMVGDGLNDAPARPGAGSPLPAARSSEESPLLPLRAASMALFASVRRAPAFDALSCKALSGSAVSRKATRLRVPMSHSNKTAMHPRANFTIKFCGWDSAVMPNLNYPVARKTNCRASARCDGWPSRSGRKNPKDLLSVGIYLPHGWRAEPT